MPIGVPKVPFRLPGEEEAVWIDIYNRLYRERVLFLGKEIDDEVANQLISIMVYLGGEDETKDMFMYINSPGGSAVAGIAIYDGMQFIVPDIHTICMGLAASMASFVLLGGEMTKRVALPHARVMIHQPAGIFNQGQATECLIEAREILRLRDCVTRVYARRTGQPISTISRDMERDVYMSAQQAQAYGIVDLVALENESIEMIPEILDMIPEKLDISRKVLTYT